MLLQMALYHPFSWMNDIALYIYMCVCVCVCVYVCVCMCVCMCVCIYIYICIYIYVDYIFFIHLSADGHLVYRWSDHFRPSEGKLVLFSKPCSDPCLIQGKVKFSEVLQKLLPPTSFLLMSCPTSQLSHWLLCSSWHLCSISPSTSLACSLTSFAR